MDRYTSARTQPGLGFARGRVIEDDQGLIEDCTRRFCSTSRGVSGPWTGNDRARRTVKRESRLIGPTVARRLKEDREGRCGGTNPFSPCDMCVRGVKEVANMDMGMVSLEFAIFRIASLLVFNPMGGKDTRLCL